MFWGDIEILWPFALPGMLTLEASAAMNMAFHTEY